MKPILENLDFPRPARPLRAVAFDLDGLMFNTEDLYETVDRVILERRGKDLNRELIDRMIGLQTPAAFQVMIDYHALDATVTELIIESDLEFEKILPVHLAPMPGLLDLLDALDAAGLPKGVATSSPRYFTRTVLGQFQLGPRFDFILTAEDVRDGKPAPDVYIEAARRAGVQPDEMLVLEDSAIGCQAGLAAGAYTIPVPHGHTRHHDFSGAPFRAGSLADPRIMWVLGLEH